MNQKKGYRSLFWFLLVAAPAVGVSVAYALGYSLNWTKISASGGRTSGDAYTLDYTIGQADSGEMEGGGFSLDGGFWGNGGAVPAPTTTPTATASATPTSTATATATATATGTPTPSPSATPEPDRFFVHLPVILKEDGGPRRSTKP